MEFKILIGESNTNSKITTLDFPKIDFVLLRDLLDRILCEMALKCKGSQENWLIIKDSFLRGQEWSVTVCRQSRFALISFALRSPRSLSLLSESMDGKQYPEQKEDEVRDHLTHLEHRTPWSRVDEPKGAEGAAQCHCKAALCSFQNVMAVG